MTAVILVPYSIEWPRQFADASAALSHAFAPLNVAIEHIGSTAVPGLAAKPIIDVLLGTDSLGTIERRIAQLALFGFEYIDDHEMEWPQRRYFMRRAGTSLRVKLHAVVRDSAFWREHLAFRDALRTDTALALQYQALKSRLASQFGSDRAAYNSAKVPFIRRVLDTACNGGAAQPGC